MPFRPGASLLLSLLFLAAFCGASAFLDRSSASARTSDANDKITQGQLRILDSQGKPGGLCPLRHTDVKAEVTGFLARVTLTQEFHNPRDEKIEAVYLFPLPPRSAVDQLTMDVGGRVIRGEIKHREEAQRLFAQARTEGRVAALLDQERPNLFTQSVTNILPGASVVRLKEKAAIPDRDFTLRFGVGGMQIADAVLAHRDERGGYFTLMLQPPNRVAAKDVTSKELVFVLDTSGSMGGLPIETAKRVMGLALDGLYEHDTFNLITFAGDTSVLFDKPVPATKENLRKAKHFLEGKRGNGGTEMMKAIRAALADTDKQDHIRIVCFLTDGEVGNDMAIISEVQRLGAR